MQIKNWFREKINDFRNKNNPNYWVKKAEKNVEKAEKNVEKIQKYFAKVIKYYKKAIKAYNKKNEEEKTAEIYDKIGKVYFDKNDLNQAIKNFQVSLRIYESKEKNEQIKQCHFNIGKAYLNNRQFDESEKSFESALKSGSEAKFSADINYQIGLIDVHKKNELKEGYLTLFQFYDSIEMNKNKITQEYSEKIAPLNQKIIDKFNQVLSFFSVSENEIDPKEKLKLNILIADAYEENGEKDSSLNHYKVCLKILQSSANLVDDQDKQMKDLKKKIASISYEVEIASQMAVNRNASGEEEVGGFVPVGVVCDTLISPPISKEKESKNFIEEIPNTIIKIIDFFGCGCSPQPRK
jgi:tetratricopeptide (TPR) repeat protein